jgi:hypothetical protein
MRIHRRQVVAVLSLSTLIALGSVHSARAATGSIDFKEMKVGLSDAHHRPMPPIVVVQRINGEWKASGLPVHFDLEVSAKVNTFSSIYRLMIGVPSISRNNVTAWTAGYAGGKTKVAVGSTTFSFPADQLELSSVSDLCAGHAAGQGNDFLVPFRLPIEVQVAASRGTTNVEERFKTYSREIDAAARCVVLSETEAEAADPQRTPVKPQRTAVKPQRTPVKPQRTAVEPPRTKVAPVPAVLALPRPDLVIRSARPVPGETSRLEAEVVNVGSSDAAASQVTLVYRRSGHVLARDVAVRPLAAGESIWVALEAPGAIGPGIHVILRVDDAGPIAETDEGNNSRVFN